MVVEIVLSATHVPDVTLGGVTYPWGTNLADEATVAVLWDLGRRSLRAWRLDRADDRKHREVTHEIQD